ncbi:preprotein translocase subunit TatA [Allobranchiibius sp. CTAmp26]|uniref:preprotein translocase subunit TatA n=1 Tax=Allobranchiibius sp. CTAmp26 TaxID=2815214 RepID=UPI001AA18B8C|nr:preprotein translocase subunit TatA [Allobranchiibius sp. CTAmp26]MBO1754234.1 preprotein translocase subunit TatA [Allobranchiibius sp. CTAmp26]
MFGITSWKLLILLVAAMVLIGPERMPEYLAKLRTFVKQARDMANGAKGNLKDQLGPDFEDIDWRQYDPRQYDPRKIIRQALYDEEDASGEPTEQAPYLGHDGIAAHEDHRRWDPDRATPYDVDAT